ncbi:MAG: PEP-CTERM sorting domain-containing protein, partial [Verrucomicrobia bacterium]|nr:PEP-CTERM sorting domain-containing protein [Verrucomicrobiota bacterium]
TTTTGIVGFDTAAFTLNTSGVDSSLTGIWSIAQSGNNLNLVYTGGSAVPEPSTYAAIFGACALVGAIVHRRRNNRSRSS